MANIEIRTIDYSNINNKIEEVLPLQKKSGSYSRESLTKLANKIKELADNLEKEDAELTHEVLYNLGELGNIIMATNSMLILDEPVFEN